MWLASVLGRAGRRVYLPRAQMKGADTSHATLSKPRTQLAKLELQLMRMAPQSGPPLGSTPWAHALNV